MKIILSRKGFDSANGGHPSPILPEDDTLISLPIPDEGACSQKYKDIPIPKTSYAENVEDIMQKLRKGEKQATCHFDPDLYSGAFGQSGAAQTHLENQGVRKGDLFLFFGWFRKTEWNSGKLRYIGEDWHVIFGYLQIGEVIKLEGNPSIPPWLSRHPHSLARDCKKRSSLDMKRCKENISDCELPGKNTIYLAEEKLSKEFKLSKTLPGYGIFKFSKKLRLTGEGMTRSRWNLNYEIFGNTKISYHSEKSWNKEKSYFQSACIGQEFVIEDLGDKVINWVNKIFENTKIQK